MSELLLAGNKERLIAEGCVLPWLQADFSQLIGIYRQYRMPHAMMLSGPEYLGKTLFATQLARYLLCEKGLELENQLDPCGECRSCELTAARSHPDLFLLSSEGSLSIKVDAVRRLRDQLLQTSHQGHNKLCVIEGAELMTHSAANALLKILEEPPQNTYFILVTHQLNKISPTIKSRCQRVDFAIPPRSQVEQWLSLSFANDEVSQAMAQSRNFPMKALDVLTSGACFNSYELAIVEFLTVGSSVTELVAGIDASQHKVFLDTLYLMVAEGQKAQLNANGSPEDSIALPNIKDKIQFLQKILEAKAALAQNANAKLLLEMLLLDCIE